VPDEQHYATVAKALADGNVVPFLGAGANFRNDLAAVGTAGVPVRRLPNGAELARLIAGPGARMEGELLKISQYVELLEGSGPLYQRLRQVFAADYQPAAVHEFLVELPSLLAARRFTPRSPLIVTTNYDHVLEATLVQTGREFDQVVFIAEGKRRGKFLHRKWRKAAASISAAAEGIAVAPVLPCDPLVIEVPNSYEDEDLKEGQRPIILKIHGAVDMQSAKWDSYVITEDDYIEYLAQPELESFLPVSLHERLKNSHILFMGYALRDWNLRVILRRIWDTRELTWMSWAVQLSPGDATEENLDRRLWQRRDVEILYSTLDDYIAGLREHIGRLPPGDGQVR
jgi:hypothetical protein